MTGMSDEVILRAKVKEVLSPSNNWIGTIVDGLPVPVTKLPEPDWLEISGGDGGFFVFYLDAALNCFADDWHETLESALRVGDNFGVKRDDWSVVEER
jgi:hypothetical protein